MPLRVRLLLCLASSCALCVPALAQEPKSGSDNSPPEGVTAPPAVTPILTVNPPQIEGPLSLEQAIDFSFARHGDVLSAREQFQAAAERITTAKSNRAPQLSATVGSNYQNTRIATATTSTPGAGVGVASSFTTSTLTTGIALSQNIFDSGRTKYSVRQSRGQAGSALSSIGLAKNSLAFEVATRFFDQLRAERLVEQRLKQVQIAKTQLDQTEAQIAAGTSARSDIFDARVPYSQAQFDLVSAQNQLRVAIANFRGALGLGSGEKIPLQDDKGTTDVATPETSTLEEEIALALSRRPDVVAARVALFTGEAALKSAKIEARPNVSASLGYNLDPRETDDRRFNIGATLSLPLFNGGGLRANVRAAQDELDASQLRLTQAQRDVQIEVETAWTQIVGQQERVKNAQALVDAAQNAFEVAQGRYSEGRGVGIALDVSVAQTRLFEAQVTLIGAQFDLRLSRLDLRRATGDFAWQNGQVPETLLVIAPVSANAAGVPLGTTMQGTTPQGTTSQGATPQGTTSQGATPQGITTGGAAPTN